jgi:threonylcarbamoyladenosine tRNA methylthiotransferase MtaB
MPQQPGATIKDRAAKLRAKGAQRLTMRLRELVGSEQVLLAESAGRARTGCFAPVRLETSAQGGSLFRARISNAADDHLVATALA